MSDLLRSSDERWDEAVDVQVLRVYLQMAIDAKSERMFNASLQLVYEFVHEHGYLDGVRLKSKGAGNE